MRVSLEAIYQALYVQGRGALRRELTACLRTGRALRVPQARTRTRGKKFVTDQVLISARPAEVTDRAVPGHWEGDLIIGLNKSAIGTLVERTTRFTMLLHLPRMDGFDTTPRVKNGPPLAGHGAEAVRDAIAETITTLPQQLRRSLTWDQGSEMAQHVQLRIDTGLAVYFCDPHSPWQRGTNENTNGLLRQYFPKGTDLTVTASTTSPPSPPPSTAGPARPSTGGHPPRRWTSYCHPTIRIVLQRPLEPKQYTSVTFTAELLEHGMAGSIGTVGEALDNALCESTIGLFKTEAIHDGGPTWPDRRAVEWQVARWLHWYNHDRLHSSIGHLPPIEFEQQHRQATTATPTPDVA